MITDSLHQFNMFRWNLHIIRAYWNATITYLIIETAYLLLQVPTLHTVDSTPLFSNSTPLITLLFHYVLIPVVMMAFANLSAEMLTRYYKIEHGYVNVVLGTVISSIILIFNPNTLILAAALFYPIFISATYLNKRIIFLSALFSFFTFLIIFSLVSDISEHTGINNAVGFIGVGVVSAIIALSNMKRNVEIMDCLVQVTIKEHCLLAKQVEMEKLSKLDGLTGLYNHKTFQENFEQCVNISFYPLQLAIIDIDNFKNINDTYGHRVGDLILQRISMIIKETVDPHDLASRYGGEEFAIILKGKEFNASFRMMENIREQICNLKHSELNNNSVTVSIGIQQYVPGNVKDAFFEKTDASLYLAKRSGKNKTMTQ